MAHLLRMPTVLAGVTEAVLLTWHVAAGDSFASGDPLAEIETDKALVELEAEESGTLGRTLVGNGQSVAVGDPIAVLVEAGDTDEDVAAALATAGDLAEAEADVTDPVLVPGAPAPDAQTSDAPASDAPTPDAAAPDAQTSERAGTATAAADRRRLFVSPLVRRLARERDIDPALITGTGPGGRIVRRDLDAWLAAGATSAAAASTSDASAVGPAAGPDYQDLPLTRMRRAIARRLTESQTTIPHFYLTGELRVARLLELRAQAQSAGVPLSVTDLVLKAAAVAFARVPNANVIWTDQALRQFHTVDIAVAVATESGLVTPVVRDVGALPLGRLSRIVADLAERGRAGRLRQHELEGGSFAISNLGMYGVSQFAALVNPPHSGILAVGSIRDTVVAVDGQAQVAPVMSVTMSVDHRALDGALAAQWLAALTEVIENPVSILL